MNTDREHRAGVAAAQLLRKIERAQKAYNLFQDQDSVVVGVSGGKDSCTLLKLLHMRNIYAPQKIKLFPVFVSGGYDGELSEPGDALVDWIRELGLSLTVREMQLPASEILPMNCDRCSRHRKRSLFEAADELGCTKIALGHNKGDFAETVLLNALTQGRIESMPVDADYFGGRFRIIRPLVYLMPDRIRSFAKLAQLPTLESNCPLAASSHRAKVRELLKQLRPDFPDAVASLFRAGMGEKVD